MKDGLTEADYTLVAHKERLEMALQALYHVIPASSDGLIDEKEFLSVSKRLAEWVIVHYRRINMDTTLIADVLANTETTTETWATESRRGLKKIQQVLDYGTNSSVMRAGVMLWVKNAVDDILTGRHVEEPPRD